jgi:adenylate kinase family enzyme
MGVTVRRSLRVGAPEGRQANPEVDPDDFGAMVEDNTRVATTLLRMRIVILGNAGSGKSTLAKSLARTQGMPMLDLDTLVWEPDRVAVERPDALVFADLAQFCRESDDWVIEGCYGDLVEAALRGRPLLIFLEPGQDVCVANCRARPWEPHKYRTKQEQDDHLEHLLGWVRSYYDLDGSMSLAGHRAVFEAYPGPKRLVTRLAELEVMQSAWLAAATTSRARAATRVRSLAR